jgi:hypothetical protein
LIGLGGGSTATISSFLQELSIASESSNGTNRRPGARILRGIENSVFKALLGVRRGAGSIGRSTDIAKVKVPLLRVSKDGEFRRIA